jgi:hypothetical protein
MASIKSVAKCGNVVVLSGHRLPRLEKVDKFSECGPWSRNSASFGNH